MTRELAVGVIGLGFGANHARVLNQLAGTRLAAVCDKDEQRLAATARDQNVARYSDYKPMLLEERLDAVIVAVPARLHEPVALAAIRAGCAVLVEKPFAPNLASGERLVHAAAAGVALMPGHIERFNPALQELERRVRAGEAGRLRHLWARRMGALRVPPRDVNVVHDSAVHDIDAMRYVLGMEPERVYATGHSGAFTPFEDSISALLQFAPQDPYLGVSASLEVNWLSPRRLRDLAVLGAKGLFVLDYAAQTLEFHESTQERSGPVQGWSLGSPRAEQNMQPIPIEPREQLVQELSAFLEAVRDGRRMPVTSEDALASLAIADALTESIRSGQPVVPRRPGGD